MRHLLSLLFLAALPAQAAVVKHYFHVQSGTGFFVNNGDLLTNEHVVRGCREVILKGPHYPETKATVRATDLQHDLALIQSPTPPHSIALLRENIEDLRPGDPVILFGYPGGAWKTGAYKMSQAALVSTQGTPKHPEWIEFSDAAARGNSGGPLVDRSGNVIGIVVAIVYTQKTLYEVNKVSGEKKLLKTTKTTTDSAIGLAAAEDFMHSYSVDFRYNPSMILLTDENIEHTVADYLVNVQCRTPISEAEAAAMPGEAAQEDQLP